MFVFFALDRVCVLCLSWVGLPVEDNEAAEGLTSCISVSSWFVCGFLGHGQRLRGVGHGLKGRSIKK